MMNMKRVLDEDKVKVLLETSTNFLKIWQKSIEKMTEKIKTQRERSWTKYTQICNDSSENEHRR